VLAAQGLSKRYRSTPALDGFTLHVAAGEIAGLVGHNGAGKTTFVEVVTGLVAPDTGTVRVGGVDTLRDTRRSRELVGSTPQDQALYLSATVRQNLQLFASLAGLRGAERHQHIDQVVDELMLVDIVDRHVELLSGGQRRRVQTATALVGRRPLLLLDEPTVGADPETRRALLEAVRTRAQQGAAVVYTTHYLPELVDLGATIAVARGGRVIARGSQPELLAGLPARVDVEFEGAPPPRLCASGDGVVTVHTYEPARTLAELVGSGCQLRRVAVQHATLDDLYAGLTTAQRNV
jgi:ABC-2 type transport system ATP-binding protein